MSEMIGKDKFDMEVIESGLPVVVDFFATWCGPCKMVAPALEEISGEMEGKAKVFKVDIDQELELATAYNVRSVPTLLFFKSGKVADSIIGAAPKEMIVNKLESLF